MSDILGHGILLAPTTREGPIRSGRHSRGSRARLVRRLALLAAALASTGAVAGPRLTLPPGLQQTALVCLVEAQKLCPGMLTAKDHGVACLLDRRKQLSQACRTIADQAASFLHGGDVHLDLKALRKQAGHLKMSDVERALGRLGGK